MANAGSIKEKEYHYDLEMRNRETVRNQGNEINHALKRLRKMTSNPNIAIHELLRGDRDDEITEQHVTIPSAEPPRQILKEAIEEIEVERKMAESRTSIPPKKKRWFNW